MYLRLCQWGGGPESGLKSKTESLCTLKLLVKLKALLFWKTLDRKVRFLCTGHDKTRWPEMYQNMQPPRKLFVIFCQVPQFFLFHHQVGQFCFILPSPAILFISPSPAISFTSPSPSILLASNFVYFAKSCNFVPPRPANWSYLLSSAFSCFVPLHLAILFHLPRIALPANELCIKRSRIFSY